MEVDIDLDYEDDREPWEPYFEGPCTCKHNEDEHGWGSCVVKECDCEAGWVE